MKRYTNDTPPQAVQGIMMDNLFFAPEGGELTQSD